MELRGTFELPKQMKDISSSLHMKGLRVEGWGRDNSGKTIISAGLTLYRRQIPVSVSSGMTTCSKNSGTCVFSSFCAEAEKYEGRRIEKRRNKKKHAPFRET